MVCYPCAGKKKETREEQANNQNNGAHRIGVTKKNITCIQNALHCVIFVRMLFVVGCSCRFLTWCNLCISCVYLYAQALSMVVGYRGHVAGSWEVIVV